jgi:hypothetical protein
MRRTLLTLATAGVALLTGLTACNWRGGPPREGEHVTPHLDDGLSWTAGRPGQIAVRLVAHGKDGSGPRPLGFGGLPADAHPVARVTFYKGEQAQPPVEVTLDHRC